MRTSQEHFRAFRKALAAGDTEAADYIRQQYRETMQAEDRETYSPTKGMSTGEKVAANLGAGMTDIGLGVKQLFGKATGADAREKSGRDKMLADALRGGKALQFAGAAIPSIPAMFIPGVNTALGAAALGAGTGALMPTQSDNVLSGKALNAGLGAVTGAAAQKLIPAAVTAVNRGAKAIPPALAKRGLLTQKAAAPHLRKEAETVFAKNIPDPQAALRKIGAYRDVPGTEPTTAQILGDPQSLMIERQLRESGGEAAQTLAAQRTASNQARYKYLADELDENPQKFWEAAKDFAAKSKDKMRVNKVGIDPQGSTIREIGRLRNSYDNARAKATLQELQDRVKAAMAKKGTDQLDSLHQVRMFEIDDALERLTGTDSKLARSLSKDFMGVKKLLDRKLNEGLKNTGAWDDFLTGYSERAGRAGQAEAGVELLKRLDNLTPTSTGEPALTSGRATLRKAVGATDDFGKPVYHPLAEDAISTVNRSIDTEMAPLAPNIRPMGSATAANLNQPNIQALQALQPVIRGTPAPVNNASAAGAITGAATVMGGPAGGAAAALGGMGTQKVAGALNRRAEQAALVTARHLFEMYRDPIAASKVLQQLTQRGVIAPDVATRAAQMIQYLAGPAGGIAASAPANLALAPAQ